MNPAPVSSTTSPVPTLGLFEKRIEGDDCLLELARRRFQQAGLGTEVHAGTPEQLDAILKFRPADAAPVVVHLPRDFSLTDVHSQGRILDLATRYAGQVHGLVLHDHPELTARPQEYLNAALEMESWLEKLDPCPLLFIEYATGLEPATFAAFFKSIRDLAHVSACIDTGHVGIHQARAAYARIHPGQDVCALKSQPDNLPSVLPEMEAAVAAAPATLLELIASLGALGKPVHFHLHDCHPLSTFSPFGVSDHLSFLTRLPLRFEYRGQRSVPPMFGPDGLAHIVTQALTALGRERVSLTLEIHPTFERLPLGDAAPLFSHWVDTANAEKMNHWLSVLAQNHALLCDALRRG
jgi:hypothetical protein